MTTTTHAAPAEVRALSPTSSAVAGTGFLLRFMLRREKVRLIVTTSLLLVFCVYYVSVTAALYPNAADRQNRAASVSNAGGTFLGGPGYGLENYTPGAMFANEMVLWVIAFLATVNILQITRNTRAEEETGRAELVRALPVGRQAAAVAAFLLVVIANTVFAVLGSVLLVVVGGLAAPDSVAMMVGLALTGLVFAAAATVTSQLTVYGRGASGMAVGALVAAAFVRGMGDVQRTHGSGLSWLSPIAWLQQTRPYVDLRLWPLGLSVLAIVVALGLAAVLATRRDLGGSLVHDRSGRADAAPSLAGPFALAFRQQRTTLLWWLIGCVTMFGLSGAFLGRDAEALITAIAGQNDLTKMIFGSDPMGAFLAILILHLALAVAGYAVAAVLRVKAEEDEGRLGLELSRSASRARWLLSHVAVVALGVAVLLVVGGALALWAGSLSSRGTVGLGVLLTSAGAFAPAVAVLIAFAAACFAWLPRATWLAWVLFTFVITESFFGQLLGLPDAIKAISPFWWAGDYPSAPLEPSHMVGLVVVALALLGLAVVGFRRRDIRRVERQFRLDSGGVSGMTGACQPRSEW